MDTYDATLERLRDAVAACALRHIAFIMDGNGRWATRRSLPRELGHKAGVEALRRTVTLCRDVGIRTVTVYAFSTENWKRPEAEVRAIMRLLDHYISDAEEGREKNRVRYVFLGDLSALQPEMAEKCRRLEKASAE